MFRGIPEAFGNSRICEGSGTKKVFLKILQMVENSAENYLGFRMRFGFLGYEFF